MTRSLFVFALLAIFASPGFAQRHGGSRSTGGTHAHRSTHSSSRSAKSHHGKIHRSAAARDQFMRQSGFPHGRKGYVVDHKIALACGGADEPGEHAMANEGGSEGEGQGRAEGLWFCRPMI